ncbi:MAG: FkbM family methyltransferase [Verrucomicrobiales bacterium]|nr:FkbM family methyltransferase [Verrucomicrobiales bacterium]
MNPLSNTLHAWRRTSFVIGWRSRVVALLCARYGNLSRSRSLIRSLIYSVIGLFSRNDEVIVTFRSSERPFTASLRKNNESDYLVFGEITMGAYPLSNLPIKTPDHVIDGGANIGLFSLLAHAAFPHASLTCYEPDPDNVAQIRKNFAANGIEAEVFEMGLWSSTMDLFFHSAMSYSGTVSQVPSGNPVSCVLPEIPSNSLLKLDVEGAEYEVLPALFNAGRFPITILMEIHEFDSRGESILDLLRTNGYRWRESFSPSERCVNLCAVKG